MYRRGIESQNLISLEICIIFIEWRGMWCIYLCEWRPGDNFPELVLSFFTVLVPGIKLRLRGLVAGVFIYWAISSTLKISSLYSFPRPQKYFPSWCVQEIVPHFYWLYNPLTSDPERWWHEHCASLAGQSCVKFIVQPEVSQIYLFIPKTLISSSCIANLSWKERLLILQIKYHYLGNMDQRWTKNSVFIFPDLWTSKLYIYVCVCV